MAYATRLDVYAVIAASAFVARVRDIPSVDPIANVLSLPNHGFAPDQPITFVIEGNQTPGNIAMPGGLPKLPSGLSASLVYYPLVGASSDLFQVATTIGGPAVALGSAGLPKFGVRADVGWTIDRNLIMASGDVDEALLGYSTPILPDPITGKLPQSIVNVTAALCAKRSLFALGVQHPDHQAALAPILNDWRQTVNVAMAAWVMGKPTNPAATDQTNVPDDAARMRTRTAIGWNRLIARRTL